MNKKLGFIGAGNLGLAIIGGLAAAGMESIIASSRTPRTLPAGRFTNCNIDVATSSDIIFLCVKPHQVVNVAAQIAPHVGSKIVVSVAAGITLAHLTTALPNAKIIRAMPNTPALVGRGMTAICPAGDVPPTYVDDVMQVFNMVGHTAILPEELFDAFIGVAGSSPAYAFTFIEALADAGVAHGLPRTDALTFAATSLAGAAHMVLNANKHPAELRDAVCSPGGTTIAAVAALEEHGFRNAIIKATSAAIQRSIQMVK